MRIRTILTAVAISALVSASAMAQTATTTTAPAAATTTTAPSTMATKPSTMMKAKPMQTDVSKACSAQADAKGLHGKERSKFRSTCKKNGGKAA